MKYFPAKHTCFGGIMDAGQTGVLQIFMGLKVSAPCGHRKSSWH